LSSFLIIFIISLSFLSIDKKESYSLNMNAGLPLKGILNFFLKNPHVKELSIIPWDVNKEQDKVFNKEQLRQL